VAKMIDTVRPVPGGKVGFLEIVARYRERVSFEISNGSEYGARWWSRRLVEVCEEARLVSLAK
jgi:hypothetical protein